MEAAFQERAKAARLNEVEAQNSLMVTSLHSTDQSKTRGQTRFTRWLNRFCLLMRGVVKNLGPFAIELMV